MYGGYLKPEKVLEARRIEIKEMHKSKVYDKVDEKEAEGHEIVPTTWSVSDGQPSWWEDQGW